MKRFVKFVSISIAVVLILITVVLACVPLWLPADKLKGMLVGEITKVTGRQASIENLKFNIFKGIELKGFALKEPAQYGKTDFIKDDDIILKYNIFALLAGDLVISKFELSSPYVEVIKEQNGRFNFSDILDTIQQKKDTKTAGKNSIKTSVKDVKNQDQNTGGERKESFIKKIMVTGITIKNGNFTYTDHSQPKVMSAKIENLNFSVDDVVLSALKPIGMSLDCIACYNDYKIPVSMKAAIKADIMKKEGDINIDSFVIGGINSTGTIKISDFSSVKGSVDSSANINKILEILPPETAKKIKDVNADILIKNRVDFTYSAGKFAFDNETTVDKGTMSYKDKKMVENFSGSIKVDSNYSMTGSLGMLLTGNEVKLKINGSSINRADIGKISVDVYSPKFAVEYMLAMFPQKSTPTAQVKAEARVLAPVKNRKNNPGKKEVKSPGIFITLKADSVFYKDVTFGKTFSSIRFVKGRLDSETSVNAYEGSMDLNLMADVNTEAYSCEATVSRANIHKFVDDCISVLPKKDPEKKTLFDDMKDKVYGSFEMTANFHGDTFNDMAHTIKGKGGFKVTNGRLSALKMGQDLADKIGIDFLCKDIPFDHMISDFDMADGKINVNKFRIYSGENADKGDLRANASGWTTVDRKLDFKVNMDFSPKTGRDIGNKLAQSLNIKDAGFAYNKDGWMPFDFRVYGDVAGKKYDYSQSRMLENVKRNIGKKALDEGSKYIQDKAKGFINGLFGK